MFKDRYHAGQEFAARLAQYAGERRVVVLGLSRGGLVVAHAIAEILAWPLDAVIVAKMKVPMDRALAFGAVAEDGDHVLVPWVVETHALSPAFVRHSLEVARGEVLRLRDFYREGHPPLDLKGRTVCIVDDGAVTGVSMEAAAPANGAAFDAALTGAHL